MGTGGQEITGDWRKVHNDDLHYLYSSRNITGVIKSRGEEMGGTCSTYRRETHAEFWRPNLRERHHFKDINTDGRIILK